MANRFVGRQDEDGPSGERRGLATRGPVGGIPLPGIDADPPPAVGVKALLLACRRDRLGEPFEGCPGTLLGRGEEEARRHVGGVDLPLSDFHYVASPLCGAFDATPSGTSWIPEASPSEIVWRTAKRTAVPPPPL